MNQHNPSATTIHIPWIVLNHCNKHELSPLFSLYIARDLCSLYIDIKQFIVHHDINLSRFVLTTAALSGEACLSRSKTSAGWFNNENVEKETSKNGKHISTLIHALFRVVQSSSGQILSWNGYFKTRIAQIVIETEYDAAWSYSIQMYIDAPIDEDVGELTTYFLFYLFLFLF